MTRAILIVMDSVGIGGAPDAADYGDTGSHTLGNIAAACAAGRADKPGLRTGPLQLPNLVRLGLGHAAQLASGQPLAGVKLHDRLQSQCGAAREISLGKDTPSGHWEIAGLPVTLAWGYFPHTEPTFPKALTDDLITRCQLPGVLGNTHASGTEIIAQLGAEHMATGKPIIYTSADSVMQIAAHEESFGLERLYKVCKTARVLCDPLNIGRVIARPFTGDTPTTFTRTGNRRDFAVPPSAPTLLDRLTSAGREVVSIGKIGDIFAHRGTGRVIKASGHPALLDALLDTLRTLPDGGLAFVNFVDFDMLFGHRRDVAGYADALEHFDAMIPRIEAALRPGDLAILTADHGCDPTAPGTDHTRECVPVLAFGPGVTAGSIGLRDSFADIGQTIAWHLSIAPLAHGQAWRLGDEYDD